MSKLKQFFEQHWKVVIFIILAIPVSVLAAAEVVEGGFKIVRGAGDIEVVINGRPVVLKTNTLADDIFIPTHSQEEIDSFLASDLYRQLTDACVPQTCDSVFCGNDGCGGTCTCSGNYECVLNVCTPPFCTGCPENVKEGGDCKTSCGDICPKACQAGLSCDPESMICVKGGGGCTPKCGEGTKDSPCGNEDGCGGTCGCNGGLNCDPENLTCRQQPGCGTGDNGDTCGNTGDWGLVCSCVSGYSCLDGKCSSCNAIEYCKSIGEQGTIDSNCGSSDSCGGTCGCNGGLNCDPKNLTCQVQPGCGDRQNGDQVCEVNGEWRLPCTCDPDGNCSDGHCRYDGAVEQTKI